MPHDIDPEMMSMLEEEEQVIRQTSNRTARFKLDKGQSALIRILPAKLGNNKSWWTRIAKHWLGKSSAIICPRKTSKHFGGNPDFECPVCALVDKYNNCDNKGMSDAAYSLSARVNFDVYVIARTIDDEAAPREMRSSAHVYTLYQTGMEDLLTIYKRKYKKGVDITDPLEGFDIFVKRPKQGMLIDLDEQCPMFNIEDEDKLIAKIKATMGSIHFKMPTPPTQEQLKEFRSKALDYIKRAGQAGDPDDDDGGSRDRGSSSRRSRGRDDDDAGPTRSRRPADDDADDIDIPRNRRRPADDDDAPARTSKKTEPVDDDDNDKEPEEDDDLDMTPSPAKRPQTPPPSARRPPPPPARRSTPAADAGGVDDDDNVADERKEHVPPAEPDELPADEEPVAVKSNVKGSSLKDRLRAGLNEGVGAR